MKHVLITGASGFVARQLLHRHLLPWAVQGLCRLTLTDLVLPGVAQPGVRCVAGDLSNPLLWQDLMAEPVDVVFHLAAIVSGRAEQDYRAGLQVNLHSTLTALACCRLQHQRGGPLVQFIYASSIAVYGTPLPARIDDGTPVRPGLSYGAHKRMIELMIDDLSRRQEIDGRGLRLSGVVVRPQSANGALSGFNSDVIREPLSGNDFVCPVLPSACIWLTSAEVAVDQLWQLSQIPLTAWTRTLQSQGANARPVFNATTWPLKVSTLVHALGEIDPQAPSRVSYDPAAPLQAQFGSWPENAEFGLANALDLPSDRARFGGDVVAFVRTALKASRL